MKIDKLETHDRLLDFHEKQSLIISQGCNDCLKKNEDSLFYQDHSPYVYIFAHARTVGMDEKLKWIAQGIYKDFKDCPEKVLYWQPRLFRPMPQENSYLFRAISKTDELEICWILPPIAMWEEYEKNKMMANEIICWSIDQFKHNFKSLSAPLKDDLPQEKAAKILDKLKKIKQNRSKPKTLGETVELLRKDQALDNSF